MSITTTFDFATSGDYTYDTNKVEFVGGVAQLKYDPIELEYPIEAAIDTKTPVRTDGLDGITATTSGTGSVKYILNKAGAYYYHSGTAWVASNGTAAQSNTLAQIITNKATFTTTAIDLLLRVVLISDGTQTSAIDTLTLSTNFSPTVPQLVTVIVWTYLYNTLGATSTTPITIRLNKTAVKYGTGIIIDGTEQTVTPVNGYAEITIPDTTGMETGSYYVFTINNMRYKKTCPSSLVSTTLSSLPDYTA